MRETKKARPSIAVPERVRVEPEANDQESPDSSNDSTTKSAEGQSFRISDLLLRGQEHALPLRYLKSITGMKGRAIRKMIETERRQGIPVLSDNISGYFLPKDEGEKDRFVKSMQHRAGEILKSAAAIERGEQ